MALFWKREAGNAPATWAEGSPGGGGVSEITSDDATVTITNPDGPTVDLSVNGGSVPFVGNDPPGSPTDGELWWDPDDNTPVGASAVIGCGLVHSGSVDVQDIGAYDFKPDQIFATIVGTGTQDPLPDLPAGIGFTVATDGSDGVFTFVEDGVWSFGFSAALNGADDTYEGNIGIAQFNTPLLAGRQALFAFGPTPLLAGSTLTFTLTTTADATSDPYEAPGLFLICQRLA